MERGASFTFLCQEVRLGESDSGSPTRGVRIRESESGSPNLGLRLQDSDSRSLALGVRIWVSDSGRPILGAQIQRFRIRDSDWDFESEITKVGLSWIALVGFSLGFDFLGCSFGLLAWIPFFGSSQGLL